jgi:cell division protein FtsW (lipid II flippase)
VKFFFPATDTFQGKIQSRLMKTAAVFVFLVSLVLTLSPIVRYHTWSVSYPWRHWIGFGIWLVAFALLHRQYNRLLPNADAFLLPIAALLSGWGLIVIWRLNPNLGLRQSIWLLVALLIVWGGIRYTNFLSLLRRYKYIWLISGLVLTGLTFFIGTYPGGSGPNLWLNIGGIFLQPSEPLKLLLIVYLAAYFADRVPLHLNIIKLLAPSLVLIGAATVLLIAQRDLGTALIFILLYFIILYLATGRVFAVSIGAAFILGAGLIGYNMFDVIQQRIQVWLHPWLDASGSSYQVVQSLLAIASGGVLGSGAGIGNPGLVPIAHSDFIFSAIGEEFGLIGTLGIVLLFILLITRSFQLAIQAPNNYRRFMAAGVTVYLALQSLLIMAGNLNLLPLTGVTLPFVSYGGSSLVTAFIALLILSLISNQADKDPLLLEQTQPYRVVGNVFIACFLVIAVTNGWWVMFRSDQLTARADNPRPAISDSYVPRGNFLDRNNELLTVTIGKAGEYERKYTYPPLSPVIGFTDFYYGQTGLEKSLDTYLRGLDGNPSSSVWVNNLLYGQHPTGLDVRLSLDLDLQKQADELLGNHRGAIVLMNAENGEVLIMASHPYFDANQLSQQFDVWKDSPDAPFVNRVTQGQYLGAPAMSVFLYATYIENNDIGQLSQGISQPTSGQNLDCALPLNGDLSWDNQIRSGCKQAYNTLTEMVTNEEISTAIRKFGFDQVSDLPLAQNVVSTEARQDTSLVMDFLQGDLRVTPLQMATAAAALSADGIRPVPVLDLAVHTTYQGWVILPHDKPASVLSSRVSRQIIQDLATGNLLIWNSVQTVGDENNSTTTWYVGGTLPDWQGSPLAVVVVLEEENASLAQQIGDRLLQSTMLPAQ